ncbi:CHAT domain-containing protein [Archangium violaceum]|uniref:CHAT domain-containing tetratricopeptide repeat protein n=1 Tax=Archangium violaceum TaxID=83451 RepID=UPI0019503D1E|nr:tetratricopeptide repeat protein [Archangium violaceum]QRN97315.1 CHAT domain-containing protein [Archangium violaceum]
MWRVIGWMTLVVLCSAAGGDAGVEPTDARLVEARAALDEADKLQRAGKYAEALVKGEHALTLRETVLGGTHPQVASCLKHLGRLSLLHGDFERAEPLIQRALAIYEATLGEHHPNVAQTLDTLAALYFMQGLYDRAEPLIQRALVIHEASLGEHHPNVAFALNMLAALYTSQGLSDRAEPLFQRSLASLEASLGEHHPNITLVLNNLATLYIAQGLYARAEPFYQRTLSIQEASLGKHHPDVAISLNNLAGLYFNQGLYDRAEPFYQRALSIREASLGEHHPDVATAINNLANVYIAQGLYNRVDEPRVQRALARLEAALGLQHPDVAHTLNTLATLYKEQGLYARAEPFYQRSLSIREAALGLRHPDVAESLNDLAQLRLAQHRLADALPLLTRAFSLSEQRLRQEALGFSESRLADFLQHLRTKEEVLYALLHAHPGNTHVQRLALSAVLLRKGRSIEETSSTSRAILRGLGPQDRETFERLRALRTQLASLSLQGPGSRAPADYQRNLKDLADQGDALETNLARHSTPLRALSALPAPDDIVDRVAAALPKDSALVEFVAYTNRPLVPKPGTPPSKRPSQPRYLALVLFPDARIRAIDLGPAASIDSAAAHLSNAFAERDGAYLSASQALYALAFKPLLPLLGSTRRLFLAPDGQLALVPFAALHDGTSFLLDSFDFSYLTSGKDLLPRPQDNTASDSVVVLADPSFGSPPATSTASPVEASAIAQRSASLEGFFSTLRADLANQPWPPLPGTRQEAQAIQHLLPQAQLFLGTAATKQRLLQLPAPAVLHIATHGFFLEDSSSPSGSRALVASSSGGSPAPPPPDPLLRSGLVLTGAQSLAPSSPESSQPRSGNSLVTALELASLDLWGTQLVVLSACDTGRGDVKLGQGVYGLRRSLVIAGAETVVMSLWKVNDDSTRLLMESYYRHLLAGSGRAEALRQAMRSLRQSHPHPHYWAPFIALGSDSPLRLPAPLPLHLPPVSTELAGLSAPGGT